MKIKYPRTPHLPWSPGVASDDRRLANVDHFEGKNVVVTEKMDGENCLEKGVKVLTEHGEKSISELCENQNCKFVIGFDEEAGENVFSEIIGFNVGEKSEDWLEIELEDGRKIIMTSEHRVFLPELRCYRKAADLKIGDDLLIK